MRNRSLATIAAVLALAVCIALAGCGPGGTPSSAAQDTASGAVGSSLASGSDGGAAVESEPEDLKVAESGFFNDEFGGVDYAFAVENPNGTWFAQDVELSVTGKDADGKVVFTTTTYAPYIMPGQTLKVADMAAGPIESLEVVPNLRPSNWEQDTDMGDAASYDNLFSVSNLAETPDQYGTGSITYTGEVSNGLGDGVSAINVNVILRDDAGSIVAGYRGYADALPSGNTPFQVDTLAPAPEHASYEVYAFPAY